MELGSARIAASSWTTGVSEKFAPGGQAAGVMTVQPEQRRALQARDDFRKQATAVAVEDNDVAIGAEASYRPFVQTVVQFDREDLSEAPLLCLDHVPPIRTSLDEALASEPLGMTRDDPLFGSRRRGRRPPIPIQAANSCEARRCSSPRWVRLDRTCRGSGSTLEPSAGPTKRSQLVGRKGVVEGTPRSALGQFTVPSHAGRRVSVRTRRGGRPHATADGPPARAMSLVPR